MRVGGDAPGRDEVPEPLLALALGPFPGRRRRFGLHPEQLGVRPVVIAARRPLIGEAAAVDDIGSQGDVAGGARGFDDVADPACGVPDDPAELLQRTLPNLQEEELARSHQDQPVVSAGA